MLPTEIPQLSDYSASSLEAFFTKVTTVFDSEAHPTSTKDQVEALRVRWIGRKQGLLNQISALLKKAPSDARRDVGIQFNIFKKHVDFWCDFDARRNRRDTDAAEIGITIERPKAQGIDISLPGTVRAPGIQHPLLKTMNEIVAVFHNLGYSTALGPQVESDFYNFEALNFPPNHPARDTQDTLVVAGQQARPSRDRLLMRTHTSPVQARTLQAQEPNSPVRVIVPGKVYRSDYDATHSPMFHQVEGLVVDKGIRFSDLKGTLELFIHEIFGNDVALRFRPSFFPFTEPSAEVDISCVMCHGKGCRVCSGTGWLEILGSGMVHPNVLTLNNYDPQIVSGFAFGMGVERIAMLSYGIDDMRLFFENDVRFLQQY